MANKYRVLIITGEENNDAELSRLTDALIHSVREKKGDARIAYQGNKAEIINTIDRMLDMEKLSNHAGKR